MKIDLNRDWSEFLCVLIAHCVRFVMIVPVGRRHPVVPENDRRYDHGVSVSANV